MECIKCAQRKENKEKRGCPLILRIIRVSADVKTEGKLSWLQRDRGFLYAPGFLLLGRQVRS